MEWLIHQLPTFSGEKILAWALMCASNLTCRLDILTKAAFSIGIKPAIDTEMEGKWLNFPINTNPSSRAIVFSQRGKPPPPREYSDYC